MTVASQQILVRTTFYNSTAIYDDDSVRIFNSGQAVRNYEAGSSSHQRC